MDNYFYLGGKKAEVLQGKEQDKTFSVRIADYPNTKWDMIATALKVATYFTLVAPLLMLVLKAVLRSSYQFEISEDSQKNSSSPPLPECHFPPLAEEDLYNDPKGFIEPIKMKMIEHIENPGKSLNAVIYAGGITAGGIKYLDLLIEKNMIFSYALYKSSGTGGIYIIKVQKDDIEPPYYTAHPENVIMVFPHQPENIDPVEISKDCPKNSSSESPPEFQFPPLTEEELCNDPKGLIEPIKMKMIEHIENPGKSLNAVIYAGGITAGGIKYLDLLIEKNMIFSYALYKSSETGGIYIIKVQKDDIEPPYYFAHPENIAMVYPCQPNHFE